MVHKNILAVMTLLAIVAFASPCGAQGAANAYGNRDQWQVIDQVDTAELGGARNTSRSRTLARAPCVKPCAATPTKRINPRR